MVEINATWGKLQAKPFINGYINTFLKKIRNGLSQFYFFSRTDGKLSKADTDYLEKRLIQDFIEKSDYQMMNSTIGNKSYIGKLPKAQSDQLYETVFEIIDDIANIDLFGVSEGELTNEVSSSDMFEIQYDGHTLQSKSARGLFVDFVKSMLVDDKYKQQIEELIAPNAPTAGVV